MTDQQLMQDGEKIRQWVEASIGSVVEMTVLPGWRPAWNLTVKTPSETIGLHARGDRQAGQETQALRIEYDVLRLLESEGIPVPHVHGWCDDPQAIVMDQIDGDAFAGGADGDLALHRLVCDYMAIMANVHRIDVEKAISIGMHSPKGAERIALAYFADAECFYQDHRDGPEPLIEFVRKWVFNNIPQNRTETALLIADAPQFFHDGKNITQIYDLELAHVGDPMADLASVRVRDINEPIGGMTELLHRYVVESGKRIDWAALDFHTIAAFLAVPMRIGSVLRTQAQLPAYVEYLSWYLGCSRAALELIADIRGVHLDPVAQVDPVKTPDDILYQNLLSSCADLPKGTGRLRENPTLSLARYLKNRDAFGGQIARIDRLDVEKLLSRTFIIADEAEQALEQFVLCAESDQDEAIIKLFHRRTMRALQMLEGYPAPIVTRVPSPIDRRAVDGSPN